MPVSITRLEVGPLEANCYLIGCPATGRGAVIDPGGDAGVILQAARDAGLTVDLILDTHCHPDHTGANCEVREATGAKLLTHPADRDPVEHPPLQWLLIGMRPDPCPVDGTFDEGDLLSVGELQVRVIHTPGHTPGGVVFVVDGAAFTGDTLFAGGIGRTDLPGGDYDQLMASLKRLATELPPETVVYPGHGDSSTIGEEASTNPWLQEFL